jgi:hypothetical protein
MAAASSKRKAIQMFARNETARWAKVVKEPGAKFE